MNPVTINVGPRTRRPTKGQALRIKTEHDHARIADAVARRTRRGWRLTENNKRTWANYHPLANR